MLKQLESSKYVKIIETIFRRHYQPGMREVAFNRDEIVTAAHHLGVSLPKNPGDVIYSFRFRTAFPESISTTADSGFIWTIRLAGRGMYVFALVEDKPITPNLQLAETKILDSTPGMIARYALSDEQALLAKLRYNRLIDIFTGLTCYSLQNHLHAAIPGIGQVETDEVYVGIDKRGAHYAIPVQAKRGSDKIGAVQTEQDVALCIRKFPDLICRPISAQFIGSDLIALFELEQENGAVRIASERHYRLVASDDLSPDEIRQYHSRLAE